MKRYSKYYLTGIAILITAWLINGQFASTPVNRWTQSAEMAAQRAAACSVQMTDGRVLVAGGRSDAAVLSTVEVSAADGTFTSVASMSQPRADAACFALSNGRVLVTGGSDGKVSLASAEVYDSGQDSWQSLGGMAVARTGHTATATPWGAVLIAGGEDTGTVELFLTNDTFRTLGTLATSRSNYAIAATAGHKVVIAGGSHGNSTISTVEIYNGDTGQIVPGGAMLVARRNFAAAPLLDGTVLLTGGYGADGATLATSEIFDPEQGTSVAGPAMSAARANHKANVLPSNGRVLLVGGTDENGVTASTEVYTPWTGKFGGAISMHSARQLMVASPLRRGALVVAGGQGPNGALSGSEVFGFSTLDTDKADYAPGQQATFSGTGWKPGEQVLVQVSAFPLDQHNVEFTAVTQADSVGRILISPFNIDRSHLGVRFLATATGSESQAQNVFSDADATAISLNLSSPTNPYGTAVTPSGLVSDIATSPLATPVNAGTVAISVDGAAAYTTPAVQPNGAYIGASIASLLPGNHFFVGAYTGGGPTWADVTSTQVNYQVTAGTTTTVTSPGAGSGVFGSTITLTASVAGTGGAPAPPNGGSVQFVDTTAGNAIIATAPWISGTATTSISTLLVKTYGIAAIYTPAVNSGYSGSNSIATPVIYNVTQVTPTISPVSTSPSNPTVGQQVSIIGCIVTVAGVTATGVMDFKDGASTISGDIVMSNGCATLITSTMTGGPHNLNVVYFGDTNYASSLGGNNTVSWAKAATSTSVTSNPLTPVGFGVTVQLIGTITSSATAPTGFQIGGAGNAIFRDAGVAIPACAPPLTVVNGSVACNVSGLTVGTHNITLDFGNTDQNFAASTSPVYQLTINNDTTVTTLTSTATSINIGQSVTYTASVQGAPAAAGNPTGTVTFFDAGSTPLCSAVAVTAANPAVATCTKTYDASALPSLGSGNHQITAVFTHTPGTNFADSTSNAVALAVAKQTVTPGALTTIPVSPITYGTSVTVRAVFSPTALGPPLGTVAPGFPGTVSFYDGVNLLGSAPVVSGGNTDFILPDSVIKTVATHTLTAQYNGDAYYLPSAAPFPVTNLVVNRATPTFSVLTFPAANVSFGAAVSIPVTVFSVVGTPTGTVTFTSGATTVGTVTLAGGSGTLNFNATMLAQGVNLFSVVYNGDTNFASITDNTKSITIQKTNTTTAVTSSPNPTASGATATFTATVTSATTGIPTGSVIFKSDGVTFATVALTGGSAIASTAALTPGVHSITVFYSNDANFNASDNTLSPLTQTVNKGNLTVAVTSDVSPSNIGQTVTFTATLTPVGSAIGTPANGSVHFFDGGVQIGPSVALGGVGSFTAVKTNVFLVGGNHSITASYDAVGDTNFNASAISPAFTQAVNLASTTTTITTSASPSVWGQTVTLNATVAVVAPATGVPTGTVQFLDGNTVIASGTLAAGATSATTSALTVGVHSLTAKYLGDPLNSGSTSSTPASFTVNRADATIGTIMVTGTQTVGSPVTLTVGVTALAPGAGTPTGTVTFYDNGTQIGTGTLGSPASFTTSLLTQGTHTFTATYGGDANFNAVVAQSGSSGPIVIAPFTPTVSLSASPNPDTYGQSYTLTATVTGTGSFPIAGTVAFTDNGAPIGCPAVNVAAGVAACSPAIGVMATGSHANVRATFTPNLAPPVNYTSATSAAFSYTINKGSLTIAVSSDVSPSNIGQTVTLTATLTPVSPATGVPANGSVTFWDGGTGTGTNLGSTALPPGGSLTAVKTAVFSVGGNHSITASYDGVGDANFNAAATSPAYTQQVNLAGTTTTITTTSSPTNTASVWGQTVTLNATVAVNPPASGTPTGTVEFLDGNTVIASGTLAAGAASATTATLTVGVHSLSARYLGSLTTSASTSSSPVTFTVNKANVVVGTVTLSGTLTVGSPITLTSAITALDPGAGTPTGTVTFYDNAVQIGTGTLHSPASFTTSILSAGSHTFTASYGGDPNFNLAAAGGSSGPVVIGAFLPAIAVTGAPNPDTYGQPYVLTATVTGIGTTFQTTGNVSFFSDLAGITGCGAQSLALSVTNGVEVGVASCAPVLTGAGSLSSAGHSITAAYNSTSTNYSGAGPSPAFALTIQPAAINFSLASSANPAIPGQPITFTSTASVAAPGAVATIPGLVTFRDGGVPLAGCSSVAITPGLNASTCTVAAGLSIGSHTISVTYVDPSGNTTTGTALTLIQQVNQASVDFTITSLPSATTNYGQLVTFNVTLAPHSPAAGVPTGSVSFFDGGTAIGPSRSLVAGAASLTVGPGGIVTAPLSLGTHHITVHYSGDSNFGALDSGVSLPPSQQFYNQTVNAGDVVVSQVTATSTPPSPVFGQPVTLATTVAAAVSGAPLPTGTVQFFDGDPASGGVAIGNPATIIGGAASIVVSNLSVGVHGNLFAVYSGDANFKGGAANAKSSPAGSVTISKASTTTAVNVIPASVFGATVTISAQVSVTAPGAGQPTGTVAFYDGSVATPLGTGTLNGSGGASIQVTLLSPPLLSPGANGSPAGTHNIFAVYSGDTNFFASPSSPNQLLVVGQSATSTTVSSSANPSVTGQDVVFTASVQAISPGSGIPTGTVTFFSGGVQIGTAVALSPVGGIAKAAIHKADLTVGDHVISVTYNPDSNFASSSSPAPAALVQTVNKAATATTLQSSANSANVGQQVTLTATVTVTAPGSGTPTGSVQFVNQSAPNAPTVLGTSSLISSPGPAGSNIFTAVLVSTTLPQGNPNIVAVYSGDSGYLTSTSASLVQSVNKTPSNILLTSSESPSILGDQVTFAITVTALPPGTGTPTGLINVYDGTNLIGTFTLQGGQYNFTTSALTVGNHAIGVQYAGDTNFQPFNSPTILQTVNKIPTSLAVTSNSPTSIASQIVTLTAVLSPNPIAGVTFASGQVAFFDGGTLIGVSNLQSNVATINVSNLLVGLHQITATYIGDDRWSGASAGFYAQTVTLASTNTQIVSSANPAVYGQPITYTMNVSVPFPGTVPAAGQVQLYDNNNAIGDPINAANGQFSITIPLLSPGQHSIVARFTGNGSFSGSQSATLPQVVNKAPTTTTLAVQPNGSTANQQISMTAVVTVPPPSLFGLPTAPPLNANLPTGSVQFVDTTFNTVLGTVPIALVGGVYTATLTTAQLTQSGSPQVLTATYSGDGYFASSTSGPIGQSVFGTQISAVNGAGYTGSNFAPDSWVTIFGDDLASGQVTAVTTPYSTSLAGTTVALVDANGVSRLLPLYFVSATQINGLIPTNTAFGLATLTVTNPQGATASTIILITRTAPGLFSANASGQGVAAALIQRVRADSSQSIENVAAYDSGSNMMVAVPISAGSDSLYLQLYGTGIRYVPTLSKVTCTIGGVNAPVLYASAAPGFFGLDQVNVQVPAGLTGVVNVVVTVDGEASNTVTLTFK